MSGNIKVTGGLNIESGQIDPKAAGGLNIESGQIDPKAAGGLTHLCRFKQKTTMSTRISMLRKEPITMVITLKGRRRHPLTVISLSLCPPPDIT